MEREIFKKTHCLATRTGNSRLTILNLENLKRKRKGRKNLKN